MKNIRSFSILLSLSVLTLINYSCKETATEQTPTEKQANVHPAKSQKSTSVKVSSSDVKNANHASNHLDTGGLKWTTFEDLAKAGKNKENKKYLVDVYTEWCGWCKVMDKKTFTDPKVQEYLRKNFHIVKFDAEQKQPVPFKNKDYEWRPGGRRGVNNLAVNLLGNRMSYPTIVYLDEDMNKITASPGYKKPDQLMKELEAIAKM